MRRMGKYSVSVHYSYAECDTISTVLVNTVFNSSVLWLY